MIYDKRYEDNIVLKRDAFQNLLTQIKNYPIIDIDYVSNEDKKDALHNNKIWHAYTDDTPCLKITYGDDRSLKGNIIFAEQLQEQIEQKKEELRNKKIELHNAQYVLAKILKAFAQNKEIQEDKELEAERIRRVWDVIVNSKEQFLKAGLSILNFPFSRDYTTLWSLGPEDQFETLESGTAYDANEIYYYRDDEGIYQVYSDGNIDWENKVSRGEIYTYKGFVVLKPGSIYDPDQTYYYIDENNIYQIYTKESDNDWNDKVAEGKIYIYGGTSFHSYEDLSPLILSKISVYYTDVVLDSLEKVTSGRYNENKIYYYLNDNDEYVRYKQTSEAEWNQLVNDNKMYASTSLEKVTSQEYDKTQIYYFLDDDDKYQRYIYTTQAEWNETRNSGKLYVSINKEQQLSFTYTNLKAEDRSNLYTQLMNLKNSAILNKDGTTTNIFDVSEQEFISKFADFVVAYNYLTFLQELATIGFSQEQIDEIRNFASTSSWMDLSHTGLDENNQKVTYKTPINVQGLRAILQQLINEKDLWNWQDDNNSRYDFETIKTSFEKNFAKIISTIGNPNDGIIARNLERLKMDYHSMINIRTNLDAEIKVIQQAIADMEKEILNQAGANVIYGYKYVKLGNNIKWSDNFDYNVDDNGENHTFFIKTMTANDNATQPTAPKEDQKSGTFRIQINGKLYEIPIKGFGNQSNQPINMSTSSTVEITSDSTVGITSKGNATITAKNETTLQTITLDGNVVVNGTFNPNDNIINHMIPDPNADGTVGRNLGSSTKQWNVLYARTAIFGNEDGGITTIRPYADDKGTLGTKDQRWNKVYATNLGFTDKYIDHAYIMEYNTIEVGNKGGPINSYVSADKGYFNTLYINGNEISADPLYEVTNGGTTAQFWRGGDTKNGKPGWSDTLTGSFTLSGTNSNLSVGGAATITGKLTINNDSGATDRNVPTTDSSLYSQGGAYFVKNIYGARVFNAVFNDYAEYRTTIDLEPGRVVIDNDDGSLSCSSQRLQPGAQIISDTYGHSMGYTETCQTPLAVAGRVLTYTYQDRNNYHAGMAVCSAPNGTVDIMTREEIKEYPDCIIGIVSEIPQYEEWGTDKVKVNNRIWIKLK